MQTTATEVVDLEREDLRTRAMYGLDSERTRDFGSKCLLARRLLERGVRFVQLYSGGGHLEDTWDGHSDCIKNHTIHAGETDQPVAALLADLKRTGLWDETLVVWGGEFGRTPTSEGINKPGRDHNPFGFSMWLAGAGVKGGQAIGATDELGFNAVENRCHVSDLHATILHLMGLDHTRLTYFYQGFDHRLTGVRGQVVKQRAGVSIWYADWPTRAQEKTRAQALGHARADQLLSLPHGFPAIRPARPFLNRRSLVAYAPAAMPAMPPTTSPMIRPTALLAAKPAAPMG